MFDKSNRVSRKRKSPNLVIHSAEVPRLRGGGCGGGHGGERLQSLVPTISMAYGNREPGKRNDDSGRRSVQERSSPSPDEPVLAMMTRIPLSFAARALRMNSVCYVLLVMCVKGAVAQFGPSVSNLRIVLRWATEVV